MRINLYNLSVLPNKIDRVKNLGDLVFENVIADKCEKKNHNNIVQ